ncbi:MULTISPECIES: hypothetical protein [unclassified Curtobacterium]|jgi:hypothetical protein|uniref:hypothetical protein n=1 Tax=unclassified Curtobacterium TaxID=257496 RepID=UPI00188AD086|nr:MULTISPECIES: hypothetical protein [unclassified Curtobacterium]MBF4591708.1 hypothetical protein [Curtobacterium sp. VKM Ac-1395]MCY1692964.1 hypothetical protein [Curtobacterium sp. SL109]
MSAYETAPNVQPVRIDTFRQMRKRHKHGEVLGDEPRLYEDFYLNITPLQQQTR